MNLNIIRVWGGGITERPEFYSLCDQNGIMVWQDFWLSSEQPVELDSESLFLLNVQDRIKLLRNHPSLAIWTGGNELHFGYDTNINNKIRSYIEGSGNHSALDGTRKYLSSTIQDGSGPRDGPYTLMSLKTLYGPENFTYAAFNPEIGAAGIVTKESMREMMGNQSELLTVPDLTTSDCLHPTTKNLGFRYHKYECYTDGDGKNHIQFYGEPKNIDQYCDYAQLANYAQYKAIFEGYNSRMWKMNSGVIIWKTQNPWPALRSQVYDYYLEQTGGYYGLKQGAQMVNIQLDLSSGNEIGLVNNFNQKLTDLNYTYHTIDMSGNMTSKSFQLSYLDANQFHKTNEEVPDVGFGKTYFVKLELTYTRNGEDFSQSNFYWLNSSFEYQDLKELPDAQVNASLKSIESSEGRITAIITCSNSGQHLSFWNRLQVLNHLQNGKRTRVLPVMYEDNYFSLMPGETKEIKVSYSADDGLSGSPSLLITGWNAQQPIEITLQ